MIKSCFFIFFLLSASVLNLSASPKKEVLDKYQKELSKEIPFKYNKKPLLEILEDIKKKSEFNIIIDEASILEETPKIVSKLSGSKSLSKSIKNNKDETGPVDYSLYQFPELTFNFDSIAIKDALYWLEEVTYLDYDISEKGILISTKEALIKPLVSLKIYDFSSVFFKPQNFYSEPINQDGNNYVGDVSNKKSSSSDDGLYQSVDDVVNLIKENIKDGNWDLKAVEISANENMINVINTLEVHQKIKSMIDKIQCISQKQVAIDFKLIQTPVDALDKFYEGSAKGVHLSKEDYKKLMLIELPTIKEAVEINSSKLVCFNDQLVFSFCGQAKNFLSDFAIVDGIPNPMMSASFVKGFDFQIHPIVSFDNSKINFDIYSSHILNSDVIVHEFKTQSEKNGGLGINLKGDLNGKGESEKKETKESINIDGKVESKGELVVQPKTPSKVGEIDKLQKSSCKFNQSLIIENGCAIILKRSLGKLKDNRSYYFIIQAQTIELND